MNDNPICYEARLVFLTQAPDRIKDPVFVGRFDTVHDAREALVKFMWRADWEKFRILGDPDELEGKIWDQGFAELDCGVSRIRFEVRPIYEGGPEPKPRPEKPLDRLEAYRRDGDVFVSILVSGDLEFLEDFGITLWTKVLGSEYVTHSFDMLLITDAETDAELLELDVTQDPPVWVS